MGSGLETRGGRPIVKRQNWTDLRLCPCAFSKTPSEQLSVWQKQALTVHMDTVDSCGNMRGQKQLYRTLHTKRDRRGIVEHNVQTGHVLNEKRDSVESMWGVAR